MRLLSIVLTIKHYALVLHFLLVLDYTYCLLTTVLCTPLLLLLRILLPLTYGRISYLELFWYSFTI